MVKEPKYRTGFDRNFWLWEEYDSTSNYLMVADVARGDGEDYSTFHILELETLSVIGEYQGKPNPDMFAAMLNQTAREFGNCMLVVENIRNKLIKIYSNRSINEMRTFIWKNGKPQAMRGYNDDLVLALAIACWVRDTALQNNARSLNYQKAFASSIITSKTTFNTNIKGQMGYKKDNMFDKIQEAERIHSQYMWIIK